MKLCIIAFTKRGNELKEKIKSYFSDYDILDLKYHNLRDWTEEAFKNGDAIIFIGAVGIGVRAIAPFVKSKDSDPAVVVCDELGKYAIPILSGHIGGANDLANKIAKAINGEPIITTATDINSLWAVDTWAVKKGFKIHNIDSIKYISAAILNSEKVGLVSEINIDKKELPSLVDIDNIDLKSGIVISPFLTHIFEHNLNIIPKCISVGVGSKKNADKNSLINILEKVLEEHNIDKKAIGALGTIDIKSNEASVIELSKYLNIEPRFFSAQSLNLVKGNFSSSEFVKNVTGTDNICERCAVALSKGGDIIVNKTAENGVTIAMAINRNCFK